MIHETTKEGKVVGQFAADGIYRKWIPGRNVMKVMKCAAVMEKTIQQLANEESWIGIEIDVRSGEFKGKYFYPRAHAENFRHHDYGWGEQRFFPLRDEYLMK